MSTTNIQAAIRQLVVERAKGRCEYCRSPQIFSSYRYEIDHIVAEKHRGETVADNLALSCLPCNRYKGSDIASLDPLTGELTRLFNPRIQDWWENFSIENGFIVGKTSIGRTTVFILKFNTAAEVALRKMLMEQGLFI